MLDDFTPTQRRALAIVTIIALAFGAYFLRRYFVLIVVAAVAAYLFNPLYLRLCKRFSSGWAATLTLLAAIATVGIPLGLVIFLAVLQIGQMVESIGQWVDRTDLNALGNHLLDVGNRVVDKVPFLDVNLTPELLKEYATKAGQTVGQTVLGFLRDSAGGAAFALAAAIIFLYVFMSLLTNGDRVLNLIRKLNPLGEEVSDLYLAKTGAMVRATVRGQFIIALFQGVAGAVSIYIGGLHQGFFMFAIFLTVLAFVPLGSGIVTIPLGIGMALTGNVVGGIFVVAFHVLAVTNIDNAMRPFLVPKQAYLNPSLMLLSVFAGLGMFGFWGIVLGPVVMILIVTTISVYLAVFKGVDIELPADEDDADKKPSLWQRIKARIAKGGKSTVRKKPEPATSTP
ncbi:AI-2E family transporter [Mycolicibacterium mengxianglii]|uniref:AI-2E family transporter n=1 Tax=Mycolicibacterium mengxianglii TaxID=2736649 RepID=UPI0018EF0AC0|nr:AI-2E family transporter [Mycolicibacterium mengxianglii]